MIRRIAHAKINLALHVTGQREDGYHLLDTLVVFSEFGDEIIIESPDHAHGPVSISVGGPFGGKLTAGPENLVSSAALMLRDALVREGEKPAPVNVHLEKNLPVASGMGGGSADAAATLLGLKEFWKASIPLDDIANQLGADVAMCLTSRPLRARGIGDRIDELEHKEPLHLVLLNPLSEVSTPAVFAALSKKDNAPVSPENFCSLPGIGEINSFRNDLEQSAVKLEPEIATTLNALADSGAVLSRMSGSGATCFGVFDTGRAADDACSHLKKLYPDWWCVATRTTIA